MGQTLTIKQLEHQTNRAMQAVNVKVTNEDLRQECALAYVVALPKFDPSKSNLQTFTRACMTNRLRHIIRHTMHPRRCPHDPYGRPLRLHGDARLQTEPSCVPTPEYQVIARQEVVRLGRYVDLRTWAALLDTLAKPSQHQAKAVDSLLGGLKQQMERDDRMPTRPPCHANGANPEGYDTTDVLCQNCPAKYTCLPEAIARKLVGTPMEADSEVVAYHRDIVPLKSLFERQRARAALLEGGREVPWDLAHNNPAILTPPAPDPEPEEEDEVTEVTIEVAPMPPLPAPQCVDWTKLHKTKKGDIYFYGLLLGKVVETEDGWGWYAANGDESDGWLDRKGAAIAELRSSPAAVTTICVAAENGFEFVTGTTQKKRTRKPKPPKTTTILQSPTWPVLSTGRPCPRPRTLTPEAVEMALTKMQRKLGANIALQVGMSFRRNKRDGRHCETQLTSEGFVYEVTEQQREDAGFDHCRQIFSSLSAVAQWHEQRVVSGNAYFNVSQVGSTEILDEDGKVIDKRGGCIH